MRGTIGPKRCSPPTRSNGTSTAWPVVGGGIAVARRVVCEPRRRRGRTVGCGGRVARSGSGHVERAVPQGSVDLEGELRFDAGNWNTRRPVTVLEEPGNSRAKA